ncbi:MAG: sigma-70 family RNA polymerase sigma factor [Ignavibacteria bacterium]|nr:sigma-70 family RNA polymerase sigma factor [Ignavibacteria bacterium]MBT8381469.1 sigma-70 family RNA polymerase sigma factor [Ignavibacteria bacterium]MBT8391531.1 sigma-70 family RNA polymerase sigma factor [Ignavibacteria bacterium]NNJ52223.1 sigma-70 family RNA polymerase sigma factor [Ignavibacteriaceae bacterium]
MNKRAFLESGIQKSNKEYFEMLVKQNMKQAYFTALGFVGSHDAALDLSQEAFIRAYKNFSKFDKKRKFFTWYYKILKNLCLNFIRDKTHKRENHFLEFDNETLRSDNLSEKIENSELISIMEQAIEGLDGDEREIIILREFEGHSYKEISEILNIPIGTVMSKLFYARKKLGEKLRSKV